jgi:EAL domain-containing protein (putative c-di-GMP-specific phosphodiesterase class I)
MAVRPPVNTPAAPAAPAAPEPVTAESLGWQLRAALPPLRLHSVSLYDEQANVLWLSEGALGPDEHNLVLESMETLANDRSLPCYENGLEDGRIAIFLPVRAPQGGLVGVAMILADLKSVGDGILERIVSPQVRTIMQKIAVLLRSTSKSSGSAESAGPIPVPVAQVLELTADRTPTPARPAAAASIPQTAAGPSAPPGAAKPIVTPKSRATPAAKPAASTRPLSPSPTAAVTGPAGAAAEESLSPQAIDDILEFEVFPDVALASPAERGTAADTAAATPQSTTSPAWNNSDAGLELLLDDPSPAAQPEPVKPPAATAAPPPRTNAPAKATPSAVQPPATPVQAPTAALLSDAGLSSGTPASVARVAPGALVDGAAGLADIDMLSMTAVTPTLMPAAMNPTVAPEPAGASPRSTGATTTSKALASSATTGSARALSVPGATSTVPAINGAAATETSRTLAFDPASLILEVHPFSKLRAGGRTRRYEVLPRIPNREANRTPAAMDGLVLQRLVSWLGANRSAWNLEPTSFSLNLSIATLEDQRFPQQVASCLKANGIAPDNLGFEIAEPLCTQYRAQVERFISLCDKLGCFVVIDDFSFDSSVLPLLRSKALRLVKIDSKLTSGALRDKLSQATVVAIVQAVKVLGIHCAAKRVESQASLQWLTAIGCDLAQGSAISQVLPIESLNIPQTAPS